MFHVKLYVLIKMFHVKRQIIKVEMFHVKHKIMAKKMFHVKHHSRTIIVILCQRSPDSVKHET